MQTYLVPVPTTPRTYLTEAVQPSTEVGWVEERRWVPVPKKIVVGPWTTVSEEELPPNYSMQYPRGLFSRLLVPVRRFKVKEERRIITKWVDEITGPMGSVITETRSIIE